MTLLVVRNDSGGGGRVAAGTSTSSSSSTTSSSTTSSTTSTTEPATSTTAPAPSTTSAPPTTVVLPVVTGQGAVLQPASETRTAAPGSDCDVLGDAGWTVTCGTTAVRGGVLTWLVETKPAGGATARRALLFRQGVAQQWQLVQRATDDTGTRFSDVRVRVEDLSGDGAKDIGFGFTRAGTSAVLAVDVIEGPGNTVVVHRELQKGSARVSSGQLDTWRRTDATHFAHEVIQFRDGAWRIVASATVAEGDVPPSQL